MKLIKEMLTEEEDRIAHAIASLLQADVKDLTKQFAADPQPGEENFTRVAVATIINDLDEFVSDAVTKPAMLKRIAKMLKKIHKVK